ncbi:MAG: ComEC/Rec2 family competence protein [Deltaproteobacteria bacterium]|nr:ComEC/Rec2 family competence protein [Deltaproteobacteria bacterium]
MLPFILFLCLAGNIVGQMITEELRTALFWSSSYLFLVICCALFLKFSHVYSQRLWLRSLFLIAAPGTGLFSLSQSWPLCTEAPDSVVQQDISSGWIPGPMQLTMHPKYGKCKMPTAKFNDFKYFQTKSSPGSVLQEMAFRMKRHLWAMSDLKNPELSSWLRALLLGSFPSDNFRLVSVFREFGLIHLLVVSGLHISLIFKLVIRICLLPVHLLYAFRLLSPGRMLISLTFMRIALSTLIFIFVLSTGANVSAQRAGIVCIISQLATLFWGQNSLKDKLSLCLLAQIFIWPLSFCSVATFVSWTCWALLILFNSRQSTQTEILRALQLQICLLLLAAAVWGNLSLSGLLLNLMIVPLMPVFLTTAMLLLCHHWLPEKIVLLLSVFLQSVNDLLFRLHEAMGYFPSLFFDISELFFLRAALLVLMFLIIFKFYQKKPTGISMLNSRHQVKGYRHDDPMGRENNPHRR